MVSKKIIRKTLDDVIFKCGPTIAQRYERFNPKDFKSERYSKKLGQIKTAEKSPVGALQQLQEDLQEEVDYTNEEKSVLSSYTIGDFWSYVAYFYREKMYESDNMTYSDVAWKQEIYKWEWEDYYDEEYGRMMTHKKFNDPLEYKDVPIFDFDGFNPDTDSQLWGNEKYTVPFDKTIPIFDKMIDKSPPLQENTVLYRIGHFDVNLKSGDTGKFKSYTSTSFNSYVAKHGLKKYAGFNPGEDRYQLKIYAPKGTKGIVPCNNTGCMDWQSEFTLGRNQKYIVISVDHLNKTAEILLYD